MPQRSIEERVDFPAGMPYTDIMERFDRACVGEVVAFTYPVGGPIKTPWGAQEALQAFAVAFPLYSYRPTLWQDPGDAHAKVDRALALATVAVGDSDPDRNADTLLDKGIELAIVKQGAKGVLARTRDQGVVVEPSGVVVNCLGAGEALGGALCHGLSAAWLAERVLTFVNCCRVIVASRRERSTAMPDRPRGQQRMGEERAPNNGALAAVHVAAELVHGGAS